MVCKLCLKAVKNTGMHTKPTAEALGSCGWSIGSVLRGFYFPHSGVEKITSAHQHQENAEICSSISSWIIEECGGDRGMQRSKRVCSFFITEFKPGHSPIRQEPAGPRQYCQLPAGAVLGLGHCRAHHTNTTGLLQRGGGRHWTVRKWEIGDVPV